MYFKNSKNWPGDTLSAISITKWVHGLFIDGQGHSARYGYIERNRYQKKNVGSIKPLGQPVVLLCMMRAVEAFNN